MSATWNDWRVKQRICEELYSKELSDSYQYWGDILTETFSKFCIVKGSILDVGCGDSDKSIKYFGGKGFYYIGLDPFAPEPTNVIPIVKGLGEDLPFASESFDNVALMSVLDHVVDSSLVLLEATRVLRVGGYLYIMTLVWTDNFGLEQDEFHFKHFKEEEIYKLIPDSFTIESTQFIPYKENYRRVMYLKARKDSN